MDQPLRFRYTSYMGEYHPAEKKVVVEFSPSDFGLTEIQELKLKKMAGARYNPEKDTVKMSCESFEHQAQNKRYLAELVESLVIEAKVRMNHLLYVLTLHLLRRRDRVVDASSTALVLALDDQSAP